SSGPDKIRNTNDDFEAFSWNCPYFKQREELIADALAHYHSQTGAYVRDTDALRNALALVGQDAGDEMQEWRDPWGHPMRYSFAVSGPNYTLTVTTAGADGVFSTDVKKSFADGVVARFNTNYAQQIRRRLLDAAEEFYRSSGRYPDSEADIEAAIRQ